MVLEKIKFSDDLEEKSFKYSVKNGLLRYSKRFDRDQSIITVNTPFTVAKN